jgi:hypothetical protein
MTDTQRLGYMLLAVLLYTLETAEHFPRIFHQSLSDTQQRLGNMLLTVFDTTLPYVP